METMIQESMMEFKEHINALPPEMQLEVADFVAYLHQNETPETEPFQTC